MFAFIPGAGILVLIAAMVLAPLFSHPDYSSISHTTSELAGQNMPNAWIMRAGFALYGLAALAAALGRLRDAPLLHLPVALFGLGLIGAAIWSAMPIDPALGGDLTEDTLHSVCASGLGFAFAAATAARLFLPGGRVTDWLSWAGLVASVALPLAMIQWPEFDGAIQRVLFGLSALWLWRCYGSSARERET